MAANRIKANGVHYTPPALAEFLASVTARNLDKPAGPLRVLDPACGSGALLLAFAEAAPEHLRKGMVLVGYETDKWALKRTEQLRENAGVASVLLEQRDFLTTEGVDAASDGDQLSLFPDELESVGLFDVVIANPPYVRTQVLGSKMAQGLARRLGLSGRVDLYQAFTKAMANSLKPGGTLGLLTSNRFLTIKSGVALRRLLRTQFRIQAIYDLGDTKLFSAAVLPVVLVAKKAAGALTRPTSFDRVYEARSKQGRPSQARPVSSILEALEDRRIRGLVATGSGVFNIERGVLSTSRDDEVWSLSTPEYQGWLATVAARTACCFEDVAHIRVGIKTTADEVFIRDDWGSLDADSRPEPRLLRPLITHHVASRWCWAESTRKQVLYPHEQCNGKRRPIIPERFPRALRYLEAHKKRLAARRYVIEARRAWYEIWVPHNPRDWAKPKVVFPDIAEEPRFFLDSTGAVVNGDCYWITLRDGFAPDWLFLLLAVANSSFSTRYYDIAFHNKLYAGRRRFMTQYVKRFPLPDLADAAAKRIVRLAKRIAKPCAKAHELEEELNSLVWESFGLAEERDSQAPRRRSTLALWTGCESGSRD